MIRLRYAWTMNTEERFWSKVDKSGGPDACWIWSACRIKQGYGRFRYAGRLVLAHRHAWTLVNGPVPDGSCVLHRCDNPGCVNPSHLFLGTNADNIADKVNKGRQAKGDMSGSRTHPEARPRGERAGSAKLTRTQAQEVRALYSAGGYTYRGLANLFRVAYHTIGAIIRKETWKD